MNWSTTGIIPLVVLLFSTALSASSFSPGGVCTHIAAAPENEMTVAAVVDNRIWVTVDGGHHWYITAHLSWQRSPTQEDTSPPANDASEWPASEAADGDSETSIASESLDLMTMDTAAVAPKRDLVVAVSDEGNVFFWQHLTSRLTMCPLNGDCRSLADYAEVRGIAIDNRQNIWLALPDAIHVLRQGRLWARYPFSRARQVLWTKALGVVAVASDGVYVESTHPEGGFEKRVAFSNAMRVASDQHNVYFVGGDVLYRIANNGELEMLFPIGTPLHKLLVTPGAVWFRRGENWYFRSLRRENGNAEQMTNPDGPTLVPDAVDVTKSGRSHIWMATNAGPMEWSKSLPANISASKSLCAMPVRPVTASPFTPSSFSRVTHPMRWLLPRVQLQGEILHGMTTVRYWDEQSVRRRSNVVTLGIWLQWKRQKSIVQALIFNTQQQLRAHRRRKRIAALEMALWKEQVRHCAARSKPLDPVETYLNQLVLDKWRYLRRNGVISTVEW
ncbi:MAG: hypothetical protein JXR76_03555 [Deltaproteobacteria bacterium]|nr:hypothetical protein [Deltaproteobacteria bacterium]